MPLICYVHTNFRDGTEDLIAKANAIIEDYERQGFKLTLRQLYYQFVSRDYLPNNDKSYDRLGMAVSRGRLAGRIDWDAIADRLRPLMSLPHYNGVNHLIDSVVSEYHNNLWDTQDQYVEVWLEKDALSDIIEKACNPLDTPFLVCRGYNSQTAMWDAGRRIVQRRLHGQDTVILHLGDHDPSGCNMTEDNLGRLNLLSTPTSADTDRAVRYDPLLLADVKVKRIALNMDQVRKYKPPPNPTKMSDTRAPAYIEKHGRSCWEIDALEPATLHALIQKNIKRYITHKAAWDAAYTEQEIGRQRLRQAAERWPDIVKFLDKPPRKPRKRNKRRG